MTPTQFWDENPQDFFVYGDAYYEKQLEIDFHNHTLGRYFMDALEQVANQICGRDKNKIIYPKRPYMEDARKKAEPQDMEEQFIEMLNEMKARRRV